MDVNSSMESNMKQEANNDKTNLIVNYLPQSLTDEEFKSMFSSIGPLNSYKVVRDRATGYSYGFGFIDYAEEDHAIQAIETLNGLQLQNKKIKVAYARHGEDIKGSNLYVRNIPRTMNEEEMRQLFSAYGDIVQIRILRNSGSNSSKGVGFVLYSRKIQADAAVDALNGKTLAGCDEPLSVKHAEDNRGKARPPPIMVVNRGGYQDGDGYAGGYGVGRGYDPGFRGGRGGFRGGMMGPMGGGGANMSGYGPMRNPGPHGGRYRYNPVAGNQYNGQGGSGEGGHILFVYNIGPDTDERALWQLFSPFGTICKVNVIRDFQKNMGKGYGFVTMKDFQEANQAIQNLNGYCFFGNKPLQVSFKKN